MTNYAQVSNLADHNETSPSDSVVELSSVELEFIGGGAVICNDD